MTFWIKNTPASKTECLRMRLVISGNDIADNYNHNDYPELQRPDHPHLRDPSPFSDVTENDSDTANGRGSIGAVDQRRYHLDNRSRPTLSKQAVNVESTGRSRPKANRAAPSDNSTNGGRGRGRGRGTPPKARAAKPAVVTINRATSRGGTTGPHRQRTITQAVPENNGVAEAHGLKMNKLRRVMQKNRNFPFVEL